MSHSKAALQSLLPLEDQLVAVARQELGINVEHIMLRMRGVALFKKLDEERIVDCDSKGSKE